MRMSAPSPRSPRNPSPGPVSGSLMAWAPTLWVRGLTPQGPGSPVGDPCFDGGSTWVPPDLKESVFTPCCFSSSPGDWRGS